MARKTKSKGDDSFALVIMLVLGLFSALVALIKFIFDLFNSKKSTPINESDYYYGDKSYLSESGGYKADKNDRANKSESNLSINLPLEILQHKFEKNAIIFYKDRNENVTEDRDIFIYYIRRNDFLDYELITFCNLRREFRTFKLSRILKIIDADSGEVFTDPSVYIFQAWNNSPIVPIRKVIEQFNAEVLILIFVSRADGYLRQKEREIICDFIIKKAGNSLKEEILNDEVRGIDCSLEDFKIALNKCAEKSLIERKLVLESVNKLMSTERTTHPNKISAQKSINEKLAVLGFY